MIYRYTCGKCYRDVPPGIDRCPHCGVLLLGTKCRNCGYESLSSFTRCPKCDTVIHKQSTPFVPGLGSAILSLVLTFILPIFAGVVSFYIMRHTDHKVAKKVARVVVAINVIIFLLFIIWLVVDQLG